MSIFFFFAYELQSCDFNGLLFNYLQPNKWLIRNTREFEYPEPSREYRQNGRDDFPPAAHEAHTSTLEQARPLFGATKLTN